MVRKEGIEERRCLPELGVKGVISAEVAPTSNQAAPVGATQNKVRRNLHRDEGFELDQLVERGNHWRWVGNEELRVHHWRPGSLG